MRVFLVGWLMECQSVGSPHFHGCLVWGCGHDRVNNTLPEYDPTLKPKQPRRVPTAPGGGVDFFSRPDLNQLLLCSIAGQAIG